MQFVLITYVFMLKLVNFSEKHRWQTGNLKEPQLSNWIINLLENKIQTKSKFDDGEKWQPYKQGAILSYKNGPPSTNDIIIL